MPGKSTGVVTMGTTSSRKTKSIKGFHGDVHDLAFAYHERILFAAIDVLRFLMVLEIIRGDVIELLVKFIGKKHK